MHNYPLRKSKDKKIQLSWTRSFTAGKKGEGSSISFCPQTEKHHSSLLTAGERAEYTQPDKNNHKILTRLASFCCNGIRGFYDCTLHKILVLVFVYFWVSLRVHGSAYRLVFNKSLQSPAGQSCDRERDKFSYSSLIYRPRLQSHLTG